MVLINSRQKYGIIFSCWMIRFKLFSNKSLGGGGCVFTSSEQGTYSIHRFYADAEPLIRQLPIFWGDCCRLFCDQSFGHGLREKVYKKCLSTVKNIICFASLVTTQSKFKPVAAVQSSWSILGNLAHYGNSPIFALFFYIPYY